MEQSSLNGIIDINPIAKLAQKFVASSQLLANLTHYFSRLFLGSVDQKATRILFAIGATALTYKTMHSIYSLACAWKWVPSHVFDRSTVTETHFKKQYGDCQVLITGCSEGIGRAFAQQFARMGFNLILVSRNLQKIDNLIAELKHINPSCQYRKIIADLSDQDQIAKMVEQLQDVEDIGIIVNNAGVANGGPYFTLKPECLVTDSCTNFRAMCSINAKLIPKLRNRPHRSAIINLGSSVGHFLSANLGVYSSNKHMLDIYSRTLELENRDRIDVLTVRPFGVTTKMMNMKKGPMMITPKDCAVSTLADLGKFPVTYTGFKHKLCATLFDNMDQKQVFDKFAELWSKSRELKMKQMKL